MKIHTSGFKNGIVNLGRQLRGVITYNNIVLEDEIYSITPHYEGDILKSIMKQLDLELSVDIPLETVINCKIGIKVNGNFEMLNYGNYVVYKSEKQEDKNTYKIICYDKMLYSMKQNESLNVVYPISIKNYLIALLNKIGLTLATNTFYNESLEIPNELYLGLDYTYRDILDEIAEATGSIICLNENDQIIVKYPTQTNDTINEEFLKDVNVNFAERYGAINTIVLSRSGESDNVYYPSPLPQNPVEIKIIDNQIMNFNNRSDFLEGIYNALNGLYYYINDFESTGILYYEVGDLYNIQVEENTYQCLMLNDEVNITTGIKEIIHTDLPERSKTDYTKADKTDRKINQTYFIVDKQNQRIESVISQTTDTSNPEAMVNKVARVTQTVNELNSKISDIADVTVSKDSLVAKLTFEKINQSEPIRIEIRPLGQNISYLYPRDNLYPSDNLFMSDRILRFTNITTNEVFDYELPDDLLYYDTENYDEFILDYDSLTCTVNKKIGYNADGTTYVLTNPIIKTFTYPVIQLTDGDYEVTIPGYNNAYLFARLMTQNIYTTQFATKAEVNSEISQTTQSINASVNSKLTNYSTTTEMNSAINLKANEITSSVSQTYSTKSELTTARAEIKQTTDGISSEVSKKVGENEVISKINQSDEAVTILANKLGLTANDILNLIAGNQINLTSKNIAINSTNFSVDSNGYMVCNNAKINAYGGSNTGESSGLNLKVLGDSQYSYSGLAPGFGVVRNSASNYVNMQARSTSDGGTTALLNIYANNTDYITNTAISGTMMSTLWHSSSSSTQVSDYGIRTPFLSQTSLESQKKNFEKLEKGLDIIKSIDIYKYNLKSEKDNAKKHIGFVIGDKYNYSEEITSSENDGADIYSFVSVCCKAIQEQQEEIEMLKDKINKLEKGESNGQD